MGDTSHHDTFLSLNVADISDELKNSARWVLSALASVKQKDGTIRDDCKPPFDAKTGHPASHSDSRTWSTFDVCVKAHAELRGLKCSGNVVKISDNAWRGIGLVVGPPFLALDFDDCIDPSSGEFTDPYKEQVVRSLDTYTTYSPSKTGCHAWVHGIPPYAEGHHKDGIELYSQKRYLTETGHRVPGMPGEIRRLSDAEVKAIYARVKAGRMKSVGTEFKPASGNLADAMAKTDYADASQYVQSLLTRLAIEHTCDKDKIEAEFKKSAVYNTTHWGTEKWERLREHELKIACEHAAENIQKRLSRRDDAGEGERVLEISNPDEKPQPLLYLWKPVFPLGKLVHFAGRSSEGKSPVTIDLIARISRGDIWPDGSPNTQGPKKSILLNIEDGYADMILPRYLLAGGVQGSLIHVRGVKVTKDGVTSASLLSLDKDILPLCELARKTENLGLVVIDPCTNYLGKKKMNAEDEIRPLLTPLAALAEELGIIVLTVGHLNKNSETTDPFARIMGAAAFAGVARSVYLFAEDKEADNKYAHIMTPVRTKDNSYHYHTEEVERDFDGVKSGVIRVVWDKTSEKTAEGAIEDQAVTRKQVSREKEAGIELRNMLKGGARSSEDCERHLKVCGFPIDKMDLYRVRKFAGAKTEQKAKGGGGSKSMWFLPTAQQEFELSAAREKDEAPKY